MQVLKWVRSGVRKLLCGVRVLDLQGKGRGVSSAGSCWAALYCMYCAGFYVLYLYPMAAPGETVSSQRCMCWSS